MKNRRIVLCWGISGESGTPLPWMREIPAVMWKNFMRRWTPRSFGGRILRC